MYRNQYFIANRALNNTHILKGHTFHTLHIYSHPSLNVSTARTARTEVLLLGYILNPLKPQETNDDIMRLLAEQCDTKERFFKEIQGLSGRFVLLYHNASDFIVINDACALRQLYYGFLGDDVILTSSPKMFLDLYGGALEISDIKKDFINLDAYEPNEGAWFGDKGIDDRLRKILPNHFLDLNKKSASRTPLDVGVLIREQDIVEYACNVLQGSFDAITRRYKVIQPLTAGWDSRTLVAAAKNYLQDIQFYIFDFGTDSTPHPDVWVPQNLSKKLNINFKVIKLDEPSEEFLGIYRKEHVFPRLLKTPDAQYLYYNYADKNVVRISGIAGATIKCVYGYTNRKITPEILRHFTYYFNNAFITREVNNWMNDAESYAQEYGIPVLDLFHWEQKVGNWGALNVFEQDIAVEEFCPHANRNLLASILRIKPKRRAGPNCILVREIIKNLWADTLTEPINPTGFVKKIRKKLKSKTIIKYYKLRFYSFFDLVLHD